MPVNRIKPVFSIYPIGKTTTIDESAVVSLKNQRTNFRTQSTKINDRIQEIVSALRPDGENIEDELQELECRINKLDFFKAHLRKIQFKLAAYAYIDDDEDYLTEEYDIKLSLTSNKGRKKMAQITADLQSRSDVNGVGSTLDSSTGGTPNPQLSQEAELDVNVAGASASATVPKSANFASYLKLPEPELPKFNGDPLEWPKFWSKFDYLINRHPDLDDYIKLRYLETAVCASIQEDIEHFGLNYNEVLKYLSEKYGCPQLLICLNMRLLQEREPVTDESDYNAMRRLINFLQVRMRAFEDLGMVVEPFKFLFTNLIPRETYVQYKVMNPKENVAHLLRHLNLLVDIRSMRCI